MIPKIIHQVWLWGKEMPKVFQKFRNTFKKYNSDIEIITWTEEKARSELTLFEADVFEKLKNFSEKSDYLRYMIIYEHGWIYTDVDVECLREFDSYILDHDFFIGYEDKRNGYLGTAIFWAQKWNIILHNIIRGFRSRIQEKENAHSGEKIGPTYISSFIDEIKKTERSIIFSENVFFPIIYDNHTWFIFSFHRKRAIQWWSYTIHHWYGSWIPGTYKIKHYIKSYIKKTIWFFQKNIRKIPFGKK